MAVGELLVARRERDSVLATLAAAWRSEVAARALLEGAVAFTGACLVAARELDEPVKWEVLRAAVGGLSRNRVNERWREARKRGSGEGAVVVDPVLSGLARRWGGMRELRELQALEVAAEAGAQEAGEREREVCAGELGRRGYEVDGLVEEVRREAAEAGRVALVRASTKGAVPMLEAWVTVSEAARDYVPPRRR